MGESYSEDLRLRSVARVDGHRRQFNVQTLTAPSAETVRQRLRAA